MESGRQSLKLKLKKGRLFMKVNRKSTQIKKAVYPETVKHNLKISR